MWYAAVQALSQIPSVWFILTCHAALSQISLSLIVADLRFKRSHNVLKVRSESFRLMLEPALRRNTCPRNRKHPRQLRV